MNFSKMCYHVNRKYCFIFNDTCIICLHNLQSFESHSGFNGVVHSSCYQNLSYGCQFILIVLEHPLLFLLQQHQLANCGYVIIGLIFFHQWP